MVFMIIIFVKLAIPMNQPGISGGMLCVVFFFVCVCETVDAIGVVPFICLYFITNSNDSADHHWLHEIIKLPNISKMNNLAQTKKNVILPCINALFFLGFVNIMTLFLSGAW